MTACKLADFDIVIQGEKPPYQLIAIYGGDNESGSFEPDIRLPQWQKAYHTLANTMSTPDADAVAAIGTWLWDALMVDKVRDLWIAARTDVDHGHIEGLRLRLDLQAPHVAALSWESLCDPDRNILFAAHPRFCLVRVASAFSSVGPDRRHKKVHTPIGVLIAAPDDPSGTIDSKREIAEIRQIMATLGPNIVDVTELTGRFTITELRNALAKNKPTILHFIGHGDPSGIELWSRGHRATVPPESLRSVLERTPSVKLVFLNSCLTGRASRPRPFSGIADQLMQAGVPAVIAMQYRIRDDVAVDFAQFLYEELLGGACPGIIDLAMNSARSSLYIVNPGDFSFGTPVLWLNRNDGSIFSLKSHSGEETNGIAEPLAKQTKAPSLHVEGEGAWIDEMVATTRLEDLTGELSFLRSKWVNHVAELRSLLLQIAALAEQPPSHLYQEKVADFRRFKAALLRTKRLIEDAKAES